MAARGCVHVAEHEHGEGGAVGFNEACDLQDVGRG